MIHSLVGYFGFCKLCGKLHLEKPTFLYKWVRPRRTNSMRLSFGQCRKMEKEKESNMKFWNLRTGNNHKRRVNFINFRHPDLKEKSKCWKFVGIQQSYKTVGSEKLLRWSLSIWKNNTDLEIRLLNLLVVCILHVNCTWCIINSKELTDRNIKSWLQWKRAWTLKLHINKTQS